MTTTAAAATITTSFQLPTTRVFLNSRDVSSEIRTETVSKHVSAVAAIGAVREAVLDKVRNIGANDNGIGAVGSSSSTSSQQRPKDGLVMDGRDIGTVVLPNADLKIFLIADSRVRAERRLRELINNNKSKMEEPSTGTTAAATTTNLSFELNTEKVRQDLERRDELDRTRKVSPLKKAADAIELDTSGLTIEGQVDAIVEKVQSLRLHAD
ncbi:hypothetical protein BG004_005885 [Podila humilis]|nr:hypothetical protein BG004_005885 [Podila humilis]